MSFFRGNSRIISDCQVCSILKTLPACRVSTSRHYYLCDMQYESPPREILHWTIPDASVSPGGAEGLVGEISCLFFYEQHLSEVLPQKITETTQSAESVPNFKWPSQISDESVNKRSIPIFQLAPQTLSWLLIECVCNLRSGVLSSPKKNTWSQVKKEHLIAD